MTSPVLTQLQRYVRSSPVSRCLLRPNQYDEKRGFGQELSARQSEATLLEPPFRGIAVDSCSINENLFTHFLDGIQRSWLLYYQNYTPVYYGYTAVVIRQRTLRVLSTWQHDRREALYLPFAFCGELAALQEQQLPLVDTLNYDDEPLGLEEKARQAISLARQQQEAHLAETWVKQNRSGWLVMDGSITISPITANSPRIVGIIKSHNTQYFPFPEQEIVYNLKSGERSSTFSPSGRHEVCSWYLRLRTGAAADIHFGLVRVEIALRDKDQADRISQWILTECRPLALPDTRWDRMIYPIRDCEMYLRSQEPSAAALGWLF